MYPELDFWVSSAPISTQLTCFAAKAIDFPPLPAEQLYNPISRPLAVRNAFLFARVLG